MTEANLNIAPEQVAFFHINGYLALPALTTQEDVGKLRDSYDRIFRERAGRDEGDQFDLAGADEEGKEAALPQILNPAKYAPEMNDSLLLANCTKLVKTLLGPEATCGFAHAIFKPAKIGAETPWHQDAAYWGGEWLHRGISIWVPLQEAKVENGCMWFVPNSHEPREVYPHQSIGNDPRIHGLELKADQLHRTTTGLPCPLPPGGCTVHGGYMMHYTGANKSDIPRRALILMGGLPGIKRDVPQKYPWIEDKQTARENRAKEAAVRKAKAPISVGR